MDQPLSRAEARRIALAAQGFVAHHRRPAKPTATQVRKVATTVGALQIDAVNVLIRAHYLPAYSRLGPYPTKALDRLTNVTHELLEVRDAHQASYIPVETEPLLRWRREGDRQQWRSAWRANLDPAYIDAVEQQVAERGPLGLSDLEDARRRPKQAPHELTIRRKDGKPYAESSLLWGRPSDGKTTLDGLLHEGRLALAGRRGPDRLYDLVERVIPDAVRNQPTPPPDDARRELVRLAARSLGVATLADLGSVFQLKVTETRAAVRDLVASGDLEAVAVEGWKDPAYLAPSTDRKAPAAADDDRRALLGPFDSLTWSRDRTSRLFDFDFSFEIYVPEAKRRYGYYVLPFLLGDRLVARADLKADRSRSTLVVAGAFAEPHADKRSVAAPLKEELHQLATWLGLERVETRGGRGDLPKLLT
jgi:uncharacterized protein YcaQ